MLKVIREDTLSWSFTDFWLNNSLIALISQVPKHFDWLIGMSANEVLNLDECLLDSPPYRQRLNRCDAHLQEVEQCLRSVLKSARSVIAHTQGTHPSPCFIYCRVIGAIWSLCRFSPRTW
jgi:hypothetical protein